jgi:CDP-glycerol glycerophosphotransferase (TagB/SpsB family)
MTRLFFLLLILVIVLGLLPNYSTKPEQEDIILNNGCLIYAIQYQYALEAKNILNESNVWAKILLYRLKGAKSGHAVTLYVYKNKTYVYDPAFASYQLTEFPVYNPYKIVQLMHPISKIDWAEYAENVVLYNP